MNSSIINIAYQGSKRHRRKNSSFNFPRKQSFSPSCRHQWIIFTVSTTSLTDHCIKHKIIIHQYLYTIHYTIQTKILQNIIVLTWIHRRAFSNIHFLLVHNLDNYEYYPAQQTQIFHLRVKMHFDFSHWRFFSNWFVLFCILYDEHWKSTYMGKRVGTNMWSSVG